MAKREALETRRASTQDAAARRTSKRLRLPRQRPPRAVELTYLTALRQILAALKELVDKHVTPNLERWRQEAVSLRQDAEDAVRLDAYGDKVAKAFADIEEQLGAEFPTSKMKALGKRVGKATSGHNKRELQKQVRSAMTVSLEAMEPWLAGEIEAFTAVNVKLISSIPQRASDEMEMQVIAGMRQGLTTEQLSEKIQERFGVAESRAELIARDQVNKFCGELNEKRQVGMGVKRYIWRTAGDARVRDDHFERDGEVFTWAEGSGVDGDKHPGEAIQCRCSADPILDDLLKELES